MHDDTFDMPVRILYYEGYMSKTNFSRKFHPHFRHLTRCVQNEARSCQQMTFGLCSHVPT
jgi:hypothetical protein